MSPVKMKNMRIQKGWTQAYVAKYIGLTITHVSDIENGKSKPSYTVLCKLEDLFESSHRELFKPVD